MNRQNGSANRPEALLWQVDRVDRLDPKKTLRDWIASAVATYQEKMGCTPAICYVNPVAYDGKTEAVGETAVRATSFGLPFPSWMYLTPPEDKLQ